MLQQAKDSLEFSERMVRQWLQEGMEPDEGKAASIASKFNDAGEHKDHGRRIDAKTAESWGVAIHNFEQPQELQEAVLTSYHLATVFSEHTPICKLLIDASGQSWLKNLA